MVIMSFAPCTGGKRQRLQPCRLTNTVEEIWAQLKEPNPLEQKIIELPRYQVPDAEQGGLENRTERTFLDGMGNNDVDVQETAYWFTEPEGEQRQGYSTNVA